MILSTLAAAPPPPWSRRPPPKTLAGASTSPLSHLPPRKSLGEALPGRFSDIDTTPSCCRILDPDYFFRCPAGSRIGGRHRLYVCGTAEVLRLRCLIVIIYIDLIVNVYITGIVYDYFPEALNIYIDLEIGSRTTTSTTIFDR